MTLRTRDGRRGWRTHVERALDLMLIACAHYLALTTHEGSLLREPALPYEVLLALLLFGVLAEVFALYERDAPSASTVARWPTACLVWALTMTCLLAIGIVMRATEDYSRWVLLVWFVLVPVLLTSVRIGRRWASGDRSRMSSSF